MADQYILQFVHIQKTLIHTNHFPVVFVNRRRVLRDLFFIVVTSIIGRDSEEFHVVHIRLQVVFSRTLGGIETTKQILRLAEDRISILGQKSNFVINFTH